MIGHEGTMTYDCEFMFDMHYHLTCTHYMQFYNTLLCMPVE